VTPKCLYRLVLFYPLKNLWKAFHKFFKGLKTSGFNIEDTHLTDIERIEKLFSLITVAFTWAYMVGDYLHRYVEPIQIKKHGNKAKSIFKHGLTYIATVLLNSSFQPDIDIFKFLSCT